MQRTYYYRTTNRARSIQLLDTDRKVSNALTTDRSFDDWIQQATLEAKDANVLFVDWVLLASSSRSAVECCINSRKGSPQAVSLHQQLTLLSRKYVARRKLGSVFKRMIERRLILIPSLNSFHSQRCQAVKLVRRLLRRWCLFPEAKPSPQ